MNEKSSQAKPLTFHAAAPLSSKGVLRRKCACGQHTPGGGECGACGEKRNSLRRNRAGGADAATTTDVPASVNETLRAPGRPLDHSTRAFFEPRFGHDFSRVRVHTGAGASESARAVSASAYTVGDDIVFAEGRYRPGTPEGMSLMAHELTHVVQQSGGLARQSDDAGSESSDEAEASRVAESVERGSFVRPSRTGGVALRRTPYDVSMPAATPAPTPAGTPAERADAAERGCDIMGLCGLRFKHPSVVTLDRVRAAMRVCKPGASSLTMRDPCLFPDFTMMPDLLKRPGVGPRAEGPAPGPTVPVPGATGGAGGPAAPSSPSLSLPFSTEFSFSLGKMNYKIELPTTVNVSLPVVLQGAKKITFALNADIPSQFSLSITLDAVPHVLIIARVGVSPTDKKGTAGLEIQSREKVCRATGPEAARAQLEAAGKRLESAIKEFGKAPTPTPKSPDAAADKPAAESEEKKGPVETYVADVKRYGEVVAAIYNIHSTIEKVKAKCSDVPRFTLGIGAKTPFKPAAPSTPPTSKELDEAPYLGITGTWHF